MENPCLIFPFEDISPTLDTLKTTAFHLWKIDLSQQQAPLSSLFLLLNDEEKHKAQQFLKQEDGEHYIIAHALLRKILSHYTQILPHLLTFSTQEQGKPVLTSSPCPLQFNLSHSHDLAVVAVTLDHHIGIDIEYIEPDRIDYMEVAKNYFSQTEFLTLQTFSPQERPYFFYKIWTQKEAVLKAVGSGLYFPLHQIEVAVKGAPALLACPPLAISAMEITSHFIESHYVCHTAIYPLS